MQNEAALSTVVVFTHYCTGGDVNVSYSLHGLSLSPWIKKFLGQQSKISDDSSVEIIWSNLRKIFNIVGPTT